MVWWIRLLVCMQIFHSSNSPVVTDFVIQNKISSTTPSKFAVKIFNIEVLNNAHNNLEKDYKLLFLEKKCYSIIVLTWIMPHLRLPLSLFPHKDCPPPFPSPPHPMMKKKNFPNDLNFSKLKSPISNPHPKSSVLYFLGVHSLFTTICKYYIFKPIFKVNFKEK